MSKMNTPIVSVIMITYNHEKYIRDAIEGVLIQKTKFPIELIIGEDNSTDSTRDICSEYAYKNKEIIKVLNSEKNLGALSNFIKCLGESKGKFIAICEGDDYWTDPFKLQKQVDFLIGNPDYAIVHTDKEVLLDNKIYKDFPLKKTYDDTFEDLLCSNSICTLTILARSDIFKETIRRVTGKADKIILVAPDYAFWLEIALNHKIGFMNDITGVYRFLHESMIHTSNKDKAYNFEKCVIGIKEFYYKEYLKMYSDMRSGFSNRFKENIFHSKKRLVLDYGFLASNELYDLVTINPLFYFYLIYKKGQRLIDKYFKTK
jgi:glycosyltransferase involved in cell wall biosynthesis